MNNLPHSSVRSQRHDLRDRIHCNGVCDESPRGALVISLDLELHWGVRDRRPLDRKERERLLSARSVTLRIVDLFEEFNIHATWAAVGFLFARSKEHLRQFLPPPSRRPSYRNHRLDPYAEITGKNEAEDPFHFAPGIIAELGRRSGQEIASHSFSHLYCCEEGPGVAEFQSDLNGALAIARDSGYRIRSYVFPRNQVNRQYVSLLGQAGILCYRGTQPGRIHASGAFRSQQRAHRRLLRLADNYVDLYGPHTQPWPSGPGPRCIRAGRYLRPWSAALSVMEELRLRRIADAVFSAAARGEIFHLWWHPEDFAINSDANLAFLRRILTYYDACRRQFGMLSLSMSELGAPAAGEDVAGKGREAIATEAIALR